MCNIIMLRKVLQLLFFCFSSLPILIVHASNEHERKVNPLITPHSLLLSLHIFTFLSLLSFYLSHFDSIHTKLIKMIMKFVIQNKTAIHCVHGTTARGYELCCGIPPPRLDGGYNWRVIIISILTQSLVQGSN